ncbi:MAG: ATP synthase F1 subunit epsilon [Acidobacteriaceae bacterium]|nr:ATP synthase F1 subunit epsilon [Acidobacteriaceae bacterium]
MADTFTIEIATPERLLFRDEATEAQIPAKDGYLGVLPGHAPLLSLLGVGVLTFSNQQGQRHVMAIRGGFLEILDNCVRVLTDRAQLDKEVDVAQAEKDLKTAQDALVNPAAGIDIAQGLIEVMDAQARIDAARSSSSGS